MCQGIRPLLSADALEWVIRRATEIQQTPMGLRQALALQDWLFELEAARPKVRA